MNTPAKLFAYGAALTLLIGGGYAIGNAVGPLSTATTDPGGHGGIHRGTVAEIPSDQPGGLSSSRVGYTLTPTDPTLTPGTAEDFAFRVTG